MHLKGQVSAEFLVILAALSTVFLIFFIVSLEENVNFLQARDSIGGMRSAYALSAALNFVHLAGDGAQYNLTLSGTGGNMTITDLAVESNRTYSVSYAPLLNPNVNVSTVERGNMLIKNNNGEIEIEQ